MQRALFSCLCVVLFSLPVSAQSRPRVELFGGYQYSYFGDEFTRLSSNGWDFAAAYHLTP